MLYQSKSNSIHDDDDDRMLWCITYQILRQSRPSLRRWTASSSSWSSRRRPLLLPPAAAPLKTTEGRTDRGQHSAATSDNTTCRETLRCNDATDQRRSSASASQPTAPERDARSVQHHRESHHIRCVVAIGRESRQSNNSAIRLAHVPGRANHEWQPSWQQQCHENWKKFINFHKSCTCPRCYLDYDIKKIILCKIQWFKLNIKITKTCILI